MTSREPLPAVLSEELVAAAAAAAPVTASSRADDIPVRWDERAVLTTMLAYVRDTVHLKCAGLSVPLERLLAEYRATCGPAQRSHRHPQGTG